MQVCGQERGLKHRDRQTDIRQTSRMIGKTKRKLAFRIVPEVQFFFHGLFDTCTQHLWDCVWFPWVHGYMATLYFISCEAVTATECIEIFSGGNSCENWVKILPFGDCLCFNQQPPLMEAETVSETLDISSVLTWLIARKTSPYYINFICHLESI
jgi:hypothetical protein